MSKHKLDDVSGVKHDKKRRKKDRKEALKYEDLTPPSTDATAESTPMPEDSTYIQSSELSALSDSTISDFYTAENVQVTDPQSTSLRPVLRFTHLPSQILDTFSPLFSKFANPSSIQSTTWPHLLSGRDIVGIAETGSGKTLAFGLPLVQRLLGLRKKKGIRAVVIAPTRELAIQVFEQIDSLCKACKDTSLKAACVYGGTNKDEQRAKLKGANVVVATPGRMKDFMGDGTIDVAKVGYLVLDEADRMLDKGFEEDIKAIIGAMPGPAKRQTAMFTATWPRSVMDLAATFMREPVRVTIGRNGGSAEDGPDGELRANPRIKQVVEVMDGAQKTSRLLSLLREYTAGKKKNDRILVFCLYKKEATRIEGLIRTNRLSVAGIHGDLSQPQREKSLGSFKEGQVNVLVATDVAARGLDIPEVKLVINVTFPLTAEDYVHRIGRTGRAGKDGLAITFFTEQDKGLAGGLVNVLKGAGQSVPEDLLKFGTTVKKKQHDVYGAFYKEDMAGKTSTKVTFDD